MFPAYAGMIPGKEGRHELECDVPRIRGDDPSSGVVYVDVPACSPHTRG